MTSREYVYMCHTFFAQRNPSLTHQADSDRPQMAVQKIKRTKRKGLIIAHVQQLLIPFLCSFPYSQMAQDTGSFGMHRIITDSFLAGSIFQKIPLKMDVYL
jgi:hypothetical protein